MAIRLMVMGVTHFAQLSHYMNVSLMVQMWQIHVINKCGNGFRNATEEECDDANYDDNDGCSSTCTIEAGYT